MRKTLVNALALGAGGLLAAGAGAESFHGFSLDAPDGAQPSAASYAAMVKEAAARTPPRNGDGYVFAFANLQDDIPFCAKVKEGIERNAAAAGIDLVVADNRLDGATALQNAESFIQRNVDYVIEFQTDAEFGPVISNKLQAEGIGLVAIDIPMPQATFMGANNPRSGFMGGAYLAQAAIAEYGAAKVNEGYLVIGELPQSGPIPAMRTGGQVAGFLAVAKGFPAANVIKFDSKNTLDESFAQMNNILNRIPDGVPIMMTAINDQATTGMLRAVKLADREADALAVGMGADEVETLATEDRFIASVGYFPENYGNYLIAIGLAELAGKRVPPAVLVNHVMVNKGNVCDYYPEADCRASAPGTFGLDFPAAAFRAHLAELRDDPSLQDMTDLIPGS